jgi:hypothetical protein
MMMSNVKCNVGVEKKLKKSKQNIRNFYLNTHFYCKLLCREIFQFLCVDDEFKT